MLRPVDKIEVLTLMDNYVDLLLESTRLSHALPRQKEE